MPTALVESGFNIRSRQPTMSRTTNFEIYVESDQAIMVYALSEDGMDAFDSSEGFTPIVQGRVLDSRTLKVRIPAGEPWYLLMVNKTSHDAAVHWQVRAM